MKVWIALLLSLVILQSGNEAKRLIKRHGNERQECDDGKAGIEIDLHGESDWKCMENQHWDILTEYKADDKCYDEEPAFHVCIQRTIDDWYNAEIPHSGPHRKVWAKYGEYNYLPPGRYVHNLEHGGVVFMYHPCAPKAMVDKLRQVATTCLYRYILTAFPKLTKEYPFAVVTYGCVFRMSRVDPLQIRQSVRQKFGKSPESDVFGNGIYDYGLLAASPERDNYDYNDGVEFCPDMPDDDSGIKSETSPNNEDRDVTTYQNEYESMMTTKHVNLPLINDETMETETKASTTPKNKSTIATVTAPQSDGKAVVEPHSGGIVLFLAVIALSFFAVGLVLGLLILRCRDRGNERMEKLRVWSDRNSADSFSIAAVVRKIPESISKNRNKNEKYHRLQAEEQSSDEDNTV